MKTMKEIEKKLANKEILIQKIKACDITVPESSNGYDLNCVAKFFYRMGENNEDIKPNSTVGYIVGVKMPNGTVRTGFSLCSPEDQFSKTIGLQMAYGRALKGEGLRKMAFLRMKTYFGRTFKMRLFRSSSAKERRFFLNRCVKFFKVTEKEVK